jgi:hypothetical protein
MTVTRKLLLLPFSIALLLALLGQVISFYPGADFGWFLTVAALSASGLFLPKTPYRVAAALLLLLVLSQAYSGHRRGVEYQQRLSTHRPVTP